MERLDHGFEALDKTGPRRLLFVRASLDTLSDPNIADEAREARITADRSVSASWEAAALSTSGGPQRAGRCLNPKL